jgi:hypothetical protein
MGDGHVVPQDIKWIGNLLKHTEKKTPVFVVTHYPLQNGDVDNWYQLRMSFANTMFRLYWADIIIAMFF